MDRKEAKRIAEFITNEQLQQMFANAKENVLDWTDTSHVNKGMTKGTAWNILAKNFDVNANHHLLGKANMIREFGEYLPEELKPRKQAKAKKQIKAVHQNPKF